MSRPRTVSLEELQRLHEKGLNQSVIARIMGVHPTSIGAGMRLLGMEMPRAIRRREALRRDLEHRELRAAIAKRNAEITRMYIEDGLSCSKIAVKVGLTRNVVYRILARQAHVVMRKAGRESLPKFKPQSTASRTIRQEPTPVVEKMVKLACGRKG